MLKKSLRLKKASDFSHVAKHGKYRKTANLVLRYLFSEENGIKVGFVISSKAEKKAARRNAIKRKLRAIVFHEIPRLRSNSVFFIQIKGKIFRPLISYAELRDEVEELLEPIYVEK